ncbi:hypothetical protein [Lacticaseibacillus saniviri]|uniref:hypothetical protein n=1 Tax=Lacticaseibacillus saniviri TaxID=931533 RepID=UPI000B055041|nr:hypothetical protein [Lacticaseibacillus saniviri]MCG4280794.1 hypothetical protein [Lacticaseibacillus saniviri]
MTQSRRVLGIFMVILWILTIGLLIMAVIGQVAPVALIVILILAIAVSVGFRSTL